MEFPTIRTTEQLRNFMEIVKGEAVDDKQLIWFVCIRNATLVSEQYNLKDIASMFESGVVAIDCLKDVQDYLDANFDDVEIEELEIMDLHLLRSVFDFFGNEDKWSTQIDEIEQRIEEINNGE